MNQMGTIAIAVGAFAGTNIDDLLLVTALFLASRGGGRPRAHEFVAGQYLGFNPGDGRRLLPGLDRYIKGKRRDKHIVFPRQVAMYVMREETPSSLPMIGQAFGGRDHTTALHSIEKIAGEVKEDERLHKCSLWHDQQASAERPR